ncbi:NIPA-like protein 2 [Escovopsis weberi]|uniref:NIPA-like protein 2 n=1 Tax=Escovopsis weberi TaxID=150374 RepID=A0A0M8MPH4_ESCWE|nr:NIPA-like protein 2 [Escovopsis weberi]
MVSLFPPTSTSGLSGDGGGHGGHGGDTLQEWSSLIGIITAIVGNVLIALALNVQRYAHTRLHKEQALVRRRARAALRRAQGTADHATYGTIPDRLDEEDGILGGQQAGAVVNGRLVPDHDDCQDGSEEYREDNPLAASIQSGASTRSDSDVNMHRPTVSYLKSPYWWLGQILITLGEMGNFLAYGFAPASIVSPLGVVALISNCIIAPAMFHEKFRQRDFWGVVIAVAGVVTVVWSANQEETKLGPQDVWGAITTTEFEIYMGVTAGLIVALMWASTRYGKRTILIDLGLVGLFGGYTALSTKGVSSMLSSTLWGAFTTPVTYALIFVLLATAIMQIRYVNKALQRFDSTMVIPIQFVMFTLCVIIGSAVLYRDFEKTTAEQASKFVGGCLLTFFGVFLITTGRERKDDDDDDLLSEADGIEETIGLAQHDGTPTFEPYQDNPVQQKAISPRPSRLSRTGFAERGKAERYRDDDGIEAAEGGSSLRYNEVTGSPLYLHEQQDALTSNPWQNSWEASSVPARGLRTISADSVATRSGLGLPTIHSYSTTPTRDSHMPSHPAEQPAPPRGHSHKTSVHHLSRTFISPSPLSSTFTTVVKDGFLREGDSSAAHRSARRTFRSSIRASLFFDDEDGGGGVPEELSASHAPEDSSARPEIDFEEDNQHGSNHNSNNSNSLRRMRSRSLSDAIGDFFRPRKDPKENELSSAEGASYHRSP